VKVRGVELRQRSCPGVVRQAQEELLRGLAEGRDADGFRERLPATLERVRSIVERVREGEADPDELVVCKRVSKPADGYTQRTDTWAALAQLEAAGVDVPPGDTVRFVVLDDDARAPEDHLVEARLMGAETDYDAGYYEGLVLRGLESLLMPVGWDEARLRELYRPVEEPSLWAFG